MLAQGPQSRLLAGRYRLIEPLGAGGMGAVWRGFDEVLGRRVAIKLTGGCAPAAGGQGQASGYAPGRASASRRSGPHASVVSLGARVRAEARAAARLSHPHIAAVHDYGMDGDAAFVVMELVEGRSLAAAIADGPLPWQVAAQLCGQVAAALAAAHAHGLAHRDISPANIMITPIGAKVIDFGVAAVIGVPGVDTAGGGVVGTPAYLAPERFKPGAVGPAVDVYALGVVLYEAIVGSLPWPARETADLVAAHRNIPPQVLADVPPELSGLYAACLAKDPKDRPSSAELARTLAELGGTASSVAATPVARGPLRQGTALSIAAIPPTAEYPPVDGTLAGTRLLVAGSPSAVEAVPARVGIPWNRRTALVSAVVLVSALVLGSLLTMRPAGSGGTAVGDRGLPALAVGSGGQSTTDGAAPCVVRYAVRAEWSEGATVDVTVTNAGSAAVAGWELVFEFRDRDLEVTQGWNARWKQDGGTVYVRAEQYNADIAAGASVAIGFNMSSGRSDKKAKDDKAGNGARDDKNTGNNEGELLRNFTFNGARCA